MAGKTPGPVPNAIRRRRNLDEKAPTVQGERRGIKTRVDPHPDWRSDVRSFFNACMNSGQRDFYESSDQMMLYIMCDMLDKVLRGARTVPVYKEEKTPKGKWVPVLDEDGNPIPETDEFGEPARRTVGSINGQALKAILDLQSSLLITEGERRRLRIDLGMPSTEEEDEAARIVADQRKRVGKVTPIKRAAD